MPRNGKGQKVQTVTGQQYGEAKAQEESQRLVALPEMPSPNVAPAPSPRAGESPFTRPTERPNDVDPFATAVGPNTSVGPDNTERMKAMMLLPALEQMASMPDASPHLRNTARRLKRFVGNVQDFQNSKEI